MSKSKRILLRVVGALVLLVVLAAVGREVFRPRMPSEWRRLRAGMSRDEILRTATGEHRDMRDLKGFDVFTQETTMFGASSYWQLLVTYDQSERLLHAEAGFIHRSCGLLSRAYPRSVL
jgi:hypothetical protein